MYQNLPKNILWTPFSDVIGLISTYQVGNISNATTLQPHTVKLERWKCFQLFYRWPHGQTEPELQFLNGGSLVLARSMQRPERVIQLLSLICHFRQMYGNSSAAVKHKKVTTFQT